MRRREPMAARPRRTGGHVRPDGHLHGAALVGRRHGRGHRVHRRQLTAGTGPCRYGRARPGPLHQPGRLCQKGPTPYNSYINLKLANVQADNHAGNVTFTATGEYWSTNAPVGWTIPAQLRAPCYTQLPTNTPPCTAVLVTATQNVPRIFVGGATSVTRSSLAAVTPEDGFSVGSYLASFNSQQSAVLNAVLAHSARASTCRRRATQGLANSSVTVQQLIDGVGGRAHAEQCSHHQPARGVDWLNFLTTATGTQQAA